MKKFLFVMMLGVMAIACAKPSASTPEATTDFLRGTQWLAVEADTETGRYGLLDFCNSKPDSILVAEALVMLSGELRVTIGDGMYMPYSVTTSAEKANRYVINVPSSESEGEEIDGKGYFYLDMAEDGNSCEIITGVEGKPSLETKTLCNRVSPPKTVSFVLPGRE